MMLTCKLYYVVCAHAAILITMPHIDIESSFALRALLVFRLPVIYYKNQLAETWNKRQSIYIARAI